MVSLEPDESIMTQFLSQLEAKSRVWAELSVEKQLGWDSPAVDYFWQKRDEKFSQLDRQSTDLALAPKADSYAGYYQEQLPRMNQTFFSLSDSRVFVDLGAAPGGMSTFLVNTLQWKGFAFSLPNTKGGFQMQFEHKHLAAHDIDLLCEGAWKQVVDTVGEETCDFVNCGAIVDRGQRNDHHESVGQLFSAICVNEILSALHLMKPGGGLMLAYQPASPFQLLHLLQYLGPAFTTIRVIPTIRIRRNPVYVFMAGYTGFHTAAVQSTIAHLTAPARSPQWAILQLQIGKWYPQVEAVFQTIKKDFEAVWKLQCRKLRKHRQKCELKYAAQ